MHNSPAIGVNLKRRGIEVDFRFSQCGEAEENDSHVLHYSIRAQYLWYLPPLRLDSSNSYISLQD